LGREGWSRSVFEAWAWACGFEDRGLIGGCGFWLQIGGRLGGRFGHGSGELFGFDGIFVGKQSRRKFGDSLS
jgi:hypothetical protein